MRFLRSFFIVPLAAFNLFALATPEPPMSTGRQADPTAKTLSDIRAAEQRTIPLEVELRTAEHYSAHGPVGVTITITNLFDSPLIMNGRMLVNHPLLQGEISFRITGPDGKRIDIQRLITPLTIQNQDFVTLNRGESMQREVDLADLFGMTSKGVYKIQACYRNEIDHMDGTQHVWKGVVWSETTEIHLD